ncbi:MAG: hydroxymethylbilane synthase [Peptococcaceae bacterium]|jgi:hydroxymethylbilane synthase|nr:hydroxymethylbilane synthase [Peptococcaceae bacterium]MBQ2021390.1 hydroxymethylbilane synthase [Peptococcaceae bacterium]MBQ2369298.1 hydroxymethylbilane synthase [Peptococcaceae bacterium]MBQ5368902.1 hydroxymethylbilane synthase [Peptococcaceae bacterium]MBQ5615034.1 hydroxymethylbilane synthase [Peptococcaceae bacterium]
MSKRVIKVVSRDSALAMWQTNFVVDSLRKVTDQYEFEIVSLKTKGDKVLDVSLAKIGDKGLFTKELEDGLLSGEMDFAVHSLKDIPTVLPEGLQLSAMLTRHNPADVLISEKYDSFDALPQGAKVGTSSLRRKAQLLNKRPDLNIQDLRGNVNTRMRKLKEENFDGIILAAAGVERMEWKESITEELAYDLCLPAVSQGVIAVETRSDDPEIIALVQLIHDKESEICVNAERALLRALEGGCQIPIAGHAHIEGDTVVLDGLVGSIDGKTIIRDQMRGPIELAEEIGKQLAKVLSDKGGKEILEQIRMELNP